jgi:putative ABC transport system permease protein
MLYKLPEGWYTTDNNLELCIRVKPSMDHDFIKKLWKDCERHINTGNVYITNITSFKDVRKKFQQYQSNQIRNFVTGIIFLLLNIFLGLLGTFWFRTQQRRSEIALQMALGSTRRQIFLRQISEGIIILVLASIPAIIIDLNIAYAGLTQYMHGATLQPGRFIITVSATFLISAIMIIIGDWFPARKATKVQPAEALHED